MTAAKTDCQDVTNNFALLVTTGRLVLSNGLMHSAWCMDPRREETPRVYECRSYRAC